jgi:hypothetical protein
MGSIGTAGFGKPVEIGGQDELPGQNADTFDPSHGFRRNQGDHGFAVALYEHRLAFAGAFGQFGQNALCLVCGDHQHGAALLCVREAVRAEAGAGWRVRWDTPRERRGNRRQKARLKTVLKHENPRRPSDGHTLAQCGLAEEK